MSLTSITKVGRNSLQQARTESYRLIWRTWLPLLATWLMMSIEGPFLAAVIARLPQAEINLAAFGISFSLGLLLEAPIIMMMAASLRLVHHQVNYKRLAGISHSLCLIITVAMLLCLLPGIFELWAESLLGLEAPVARQVKESLWLFLAWPGMIGLRRFYQGILIRYGASRKVGLATIVRLVGMVLAALMLSQLTSLSGASVGTLSLSLAVTAEALAVVCLAQPELKKIPEWHVDSQEEPLELKSFIHFYWPLALMATIGMTIQPLVTFGMGQARYSLESLAVLPVLYGMTFIFRAIPLSFQETIINIMSEGEKHFVHLKRFAWILGFSLTASLLIIATSPLADIWFLHVSGLSPRLAEIATTPLIILVGTPALSLLLCWQRSQRIHQKRTAAISKASVLELIGVSLTLWVGIRFLDLYGALAAAWALMLGRALAVAFLLQPIRR